MAGRTAVVLVAAMSLVAAVLTACSGEGTSPRAQSLSPTAASTSSSVPSSAVADPSDASTSPSSATSVSVSTPSVQPAAQGAVDAYIALYNATTPLDASPARADVGTLAPYVIASILRQLRGEYADLARHHLAYRGTPGDPRVKVLSASSTSVALTSCPVASRTDPEIEYNVKTGKIISDASRDASYLKTISMLFRGGRWRISSIVPNLKKKCS